MNKCSSKGENYPHLSLLTSQVNWLETAEELDDLFLGDAEVKPSHILPVKA